MSGSCRRAPRPRSRATALRERFSAFASRTRSSGSSRGSAARARRPGHWGAEGGQRRSGARAGGPAPSTRESARTRQRPPDCARRDGGCRCGLQARAAASSRRRAASIRAQRRRRAGIPRSIHRSSAVTLMPSRPAAAPFGTDGPTCRHSSASTDRAPPAARHRASAAARCEVARSGRGARSAAYA